jgi:voltage-gated sodium channel
MIWFDRLITTILLLEITIRFIGEENKKDFFKNPWNLFNTLIVAVSMIPINNADMALVARLIRVFRVLRMVSIISELRMLLNSLVNALPRLGYVLLLMFIIFYIFPPLAAHYLRRLIPSSGEISPSLC